VRIRLIAEATAVVAHMIYFPFVVLLVLLVAQSRLFDDWHWNVPLVAVTLLSATTALVCAVALQWAVKKARENALDDLDGLLRPRPEKADDPVRQTVEEIRTEVQSMKSGAFAGFSQNPVVYALLLPLGGGGGLAALEALLSYM
jgi:hypothetical protein